MRPCVGIEGICPPLCKWSDLQDGTYSLADVVLFNETLLELYESHQKAMNSKGG